MLALDWNPKQRGHIFELPPNDPKTLERPKSVTFADSIPFEVMTVSQAGPVKILKIFTMLDEIFEQKILTIYSLYSYEFLSYKITDDTTLNQLLELIEEDLGIIKSDIDFILPLEQTIEQIDNNTKPIDLFLSNFYDKPMLYVIKKSKKSELILKDDIRPDIPITIQLLLENDKLKLKQHIMKHFMNNCYHFVRNEKILYETFLNGIKNYVLLLNHEITLYRSKMQEMSKLSYGIRGSMNLYKIILNKNKEILSTKCYNNNEILTQTTLNWDEQQLKLGQNIIKLCEATDKILIRFESVLRRSRELIVNDIIEKPKLHLFDL